MLHRRVCPLWQRRLLLLVGLLWLLMLFLLLLAVVLLLVCLRCRACMLLRMLSWNVMLLCRKRRTTCPYLWHVRPFHSRNGQWIEVRELAVAMHRVEVVTCRVRYWYLCKCVSLVHTLHNRH